MQEHARAIIAAAAYAVITGREVVSIFSYSADRYRNIDASFADGKLTALDHARGAHFTGPLDHIYDQGDNAYVQMKIVANRANGYHHGEGHHYEVTVKGDAMELYDHGEQAWFNYSV